MTERSRAEGLVDAIQGAVQNWMAAHSNGGMLTAFVFLGEYMDLDGETGWLIAEGDQSVTHSLGLANTMTTVFQTGVRNQFDPVVYDEDDD